MANLGFIQLHRKFLKWEWYDDANTMRLFIHCLLNANHCEKKWRGIKIPRGSFLTGRLKLAQALNLTEQQIRTAISRLKSTNEITIKTTSQYSIITVNNWDTYQQNNQQNNQQITNEQPTSNQRVTTTNNDNNDNNDNNILLLQQESTENILKNWYGSEYKNVHLTDTEYQKLLALTMSKKALNLIIEEFSQKVAEKKEQNWSPDSPQIHYARLKKYWEYRRKNPNKFKNTVSEPQVPVYSADLED